MTKLSAFVRPLARKFFCQSNAPILAQQRSYCQPPNFTENNGFPVHQVVKPGSQYGGKYTVTMIPGDGIGPEMMNHVQEVYRVARVPVEFEKVLFDKEHPSDLHLKKATQSIRRTGLCLKGGLEKPRVEYTISQNALLRRALNLGINLVHVKSYKNVRAQFNNIDLVVVRQNTEGEYSMLEHFVSPDVVENIKVITREKTQELGEFAFAFVKKYGRKKIHCIHKANIMKISDGLFLHTMNTVAKNQPSVLYQDMIVDNTSMQCAKDPTQFDVLVTPNLYGSIIQNIACGLAGGAGLYSGINFGERYTVFEPATRNTGSDLKANEGNPVAMLNASVDLLRHLDLKKAAHVISEAIRTTLEEDMVHTKDLGGTASTQEVVTNIIDHVKVNINKDFSPEDLENNY